MKVILIVLSLFILGCNSDPNPMTQYVDVDAVIININHNDQAISKGKYHNPVTCDVALVKIIGKNAYRELNSCERWTNRTLDKHWFYNHKVGDTIHFDYATKIYFFPINRK